MLGGIYQGWAEERFEVTELIPRKRTKSHGIPSAAELRNSVKNQVRGIITRHEFRAAEEFREN